MSARDLRERRRIWESRCPFLLAERDELAAELEATRRVLDEARAELQDMKDDRDTVSASVEEHPE